MAILGVDLGASYAKASIFSSEQKKIVANVTRRRERATLDDVASWEWGDESLWSDLVGIIRCLDRESLAEIDVLSVITAWPCVAFGRDKAWTPFVRMDDQRNTTFAAAVADATGRQTFCYELVPRLRWVRETYPALRRGVLEIETASSYLTRRLTGVPSIDSVSWNALAPVELVDLEEISRAPIRDPFDTLDVLRPEIRADLGIPHHREVTVIVGGPDTLGPAALGETIAPRAGVVVSGTFGIALIPGGFARSAAMHMLANPAMTRPWDLAGFVPELGRLFARGVGSDELARASLGTPSDRDGSYADAVSIDPALSFPVEGVVAMRSKLRWHRPVARASDRYAAIASAACERLFAERTTVQVAEFWLTIGGAAGSPVFREAIASRVPSPVAALPPGSADALGAVALGVLAVYGYERGAPLIASLVGSLVSTD